MIDQASVYKQLNQFLLDHYNGRLTMMQVLWEAYALGYEQGADREAGYQFGPVE